MRPVPEIAGVDLAFGNTKHLPPMTEIPQEFQNGRSPWSNLFHRWFYSGLPATVEFYPKEGVNPEKALKAISAIMVSFEPKHEHKEAGVTFLLSQWFDKVVIPAEGEKPESVFP